MNYLRLIFVALLSTFILVPGIMHAAYFSQTETPHITEPVQGDAFLSGEKATLDATISGDLFTISGNVDVNKRVERSIFAIGQEVNVVEGSGYNTFVVGQAVEIKGTIGHDLYVVGDQVVIADSADIKGDVTIFGSSVSLGGTIAGSVSVQAGQLTSHARVQEDFSSRSNSITFTGGSIGGDLSYTANQEASGLAAVQTTGKVTYTQASQTDVTRLIWRSILMTLLMILVTGAALILLLPKKVQGVSHVLASRWGMSLAYGVIAFIVTPMLCFLILTTKVGVPIAFIGLATYVILLIVAGTLSYIVLGDAITRLLRLPKRNVWLSLVLGALIMTAFALLPKVGGILALAFFIGLVLPSLGASIIWWRKQLS